MAGMRVHELAKEFGLSSKEMLNKLHELDIAAKSHASILTDADVAKAREAFAATKDSAADDSSKKKASSAKVKTEAEKAKEKEEAERRAAREKELAEREAARSARGEEKDASGASVDEAAKKRCSRSSPHQAVLRAWLRR